MAAAIMSRRVVRWIPRVLCIAFALFISVFALDSFEGDGTAIQKAGVFLMHLIPTAVLLLFLWLAWRREWIGTIIFPLLAVLHVVTKPGLDWMAYAFIDGPLLLMAVLFWLSWRARKATEQEARATGPA